MIYKKEYMKKKDKVSAVGNASTLRTLEESSIVKSNNTGIPTAMKERAEAASGLSFDDVRVHYNSDKPAPLQALAYTQGNEVFIGPGQEQHLGHELGHVVQQKQGRVKPTATINQLAVNTEHSLEHEADEYEKKLSGKRVTQMLLKEVAVPSETMSGTSLHGDDPYRYHTIAHYSLNSHPIGTSWSDIAKYKVEGVEGGEHAEDAICDTIETYVIKYGKENLNGAVLDIILSSSPCQQCGERLNILVEEYGLIVNVTAAKLYQGIRNGGAFSGTAKFNLTIASKGESEKILQF